MLTSDEYQWLWQMYLGAGVVFLTLFLFLIRFIKSISARIVLFSLMAVFLFTTVIVHETGLKAPAMLVWLLDTFLKVDDPNAEAITNILRNLAIASLVIFTLIIARIVAKNE